MNTKFQISLIRITRPVSVYLYEFTRYTVIKGPRGGTMTERMTSKGQSIWETSGRNHLTELGDEMSLSEDTRTVMTGQNE